MVSAQQSYIYNSSSAFKMYTPVKTDSTVGQIVPAAATTDFPLGVLAEDTLASPSGQTIGVLVGPILKGVAGGSITIGDIIGVTASGLFNTITLNGTYVTTAKFAWGQALSAASSSGDIIEFRFAPFLISTAS